MPKTLFKCIGVRYFHIFYEILIFASFSGFCPTVLTYSYFNENTQNIYIFEVSDKKQIYKIVINDITIYLPKM